MSSAFMQHRKSQHEVRPLTEERKSLLGDKPFGKKSAPFVDRSGLCPCPGPRKCFSSRLFDPCRPFLTLWSEWPCRYSVLSRYGLSSMTFGPRHRWISLSSPRAPPGVGRDVLCLLRLRGPCTCCHSCLPAIFVSLQKGGWFSGGATFSSFAILFRLN